VVICRHCSIVAASGSVAAGLVDGIKKRGKRSPSFTAGD
jgi:hypothetical protein